MVLNTINRIAAKVEVGFNVCCNLPTRLGKEISACRGAFGVAQVAGGAFANFVGLCEVATGLFFSRSLLQHGLRVLTFGCEHVVHGALNTAVGFIEFALHFTPYHIGSAVFLLVKARNGFQPTLPYKTNYGVEVPQLPPPGGNDAIPLPPMRPALQAYPEGVSNGGLYLVPVPPAYPASQVYTHERMPIPVPGAVPPSSFS